MQSSPKVPVTVAVLVCLASLYFGWRVSQSSYAVDTDNGGHRPTGKFSAIRHATSNLSVLYVMDPSMYSFEDLHVDEFTNATVVPWMRELRDALTANEAVPRGSPLLVNFLHELTVVSGCSL